MKDSRKVYFIFPLLRGRPHTQGETFHTKKVHFHYDIYKIYLYVYVDFRNYYKNYAKLDVN